jgi:hypothetical protein
MSALLKNNNIINNDFNNINKVNINNISLKITKDTSTKNFKEELEFMDILKNKIIKRAKAFSYNNNFKNNNNKVLILNSRVFEYYTSYKDILLNYKLINNKSIIIANRIKLFIKDIRNIPIIINNKTLFIKNINYILNIKIILISLKKLINKDWEILFK